MHHGELSHVNLHRKPLPPAKGSEKGQQQPRNTNGQMREGREHWVEVTSSGLTHHCGDSGFGPLCPLMLHVFQTHRVPAVARLTEGSGSESGNVKKQSQVFIGKNFGIMTDVTQLDIDEGNSNSLGGENARSDQITLKEGRYSLKMSVISVDSGEIQLTHIVHSYPKSTNNDNDSILNIIAADFPSLIPISYRSYSEHIAQHTLWITIFVVLFYFINMYFGRHKEKVA